MGDDLFARSKDLRTRLPSKLDICSRRDATMSRRSSLSSRRRAFRSFVISSNRLNLSDSISPRKASVRLMCRRRLCCVASTTQQNNPGKPPRAYLMALCSGPFFTIEHAYSSNTVFPEFLDETVPPHDMPILVGHRCEVEALRDESPISKKERIRWGERRRRQSQSHYYCLVGKGFKAIGQLRDHMWTSRVRGTKGASEETRTRLSARMV